MFLRKLRRSCQHLRSVTRGVSCIFLVITVSFYLIYGMADGLTHQPSAIDLIVLREHHGEGIDGIAANYRTAANQSDFSIGVVAPQKSVVGPFRKMGSPEFNRVYYDIRNPPKLFTEWYKRQHSQCNGRFIGYANEVAILSDVIMDKAHSNGRSGGENFTSLWKQKEGDEYYKFTAGFLQVNCTKLPQYKLKDKSHVDSWIKSLSVPQDDVTERHESGVWIGVTRYEYVNLYHTMTDWYNAFFVMTFFNLTQQQTNILLIDGHPWGSLDPVWSTLFNSSARIGQLPQRTRFHSFITGHQGYSSPLFKGIHNIKSMKVDLLEEFREFFLSSYGLPTDRPVNCSSLSLLFIWRRPYLAHPRNPSGDVHRKVKNEDAIMDSVRKRYPHFKLNGIQTDALSMREQLRFASESDILVGMHGAGLSLCLFLPKHGALLEFMPKYITPSSKTHFTAMATWRGMIYERWVNADSKLEYNDHYTRIPPDIVIQRIETIRGKICKGD